MFRGVHLKLVFKKNKVYGSKEKVRGNLGKNPRNLNKLFGSLKRNMYDLFKEKEEITRKEGTEGLADQEAMESRISCSGNQRQSQKLTSKGRKSHIAGKRPPQAGSFNPFHQSL